MRVQVHQATKSYVNCQRALQCKGLPRPLSGSPNNPSRLSPCTARGQRSVCKTACMHDTASDVASVSSSHVHVGQNKPFVCAPLQGNSHEAELLRQELLKGGLLTAIECCNLG